MWEFYKISEKFHKILYKNFERIQLIQVFRWAMQPTGILFKVADLGFLWKNYYSKTLSFFYYKSFRSSLTSMQRVMDIKINTISVYLMGHIFTEIALQLDNFLKVISRSVPINSLSRIYDPKGKLYKLVSWNQAAVYHFIVIKVHAILSAGFAHSF